jgi:queuine tRNA-ribosyltransferase
MTKIIPILNSLAGSALTYDNWLASTIHTLSQDLNTLLIRPGIEVLSQLNAIKQYYNWPGKVVINASNLPANKQGGVTFSSPVDGSKHTYTWQHIIELLRNLKPEIIILPNYVISYLEAATLSSVLYFTSSEQHIDPAKQLHVPWIGGTFEDFQNQLGQHQQRVCYITGNFTVSQLRMLMPMNLLIETDTPAQDALKAVVYTKEATIDLSSTEYSTDFALIEKTCACVVCKQKFTRAYLHHLYLNTPLLANRYLLQHNISLIENS